MSVQRPPTPRVISPSPTPSESGTRESYFAPTTRSRAAEASRVQPIAEHDAPQRADEDPELARARSRGRAPQPERKTPRREKMTNAGVSSGLALDPGSTSRVTRRGGQPQNATLAPTGKKGARSTDLLSPESAAPSGMGSAYWRTLSRSPSPLGLIPIHRDWRMFVHKHEVPRKALHVSIGFLGLWLYHSGVQTTDLHPVLFSVFIPIFATDLIRFRFPAVNRYYVRTLGAFMRESEAHDHYNGVISYLAGLWLTTRFCNKDVAVVSALLLSWCDTAASTFGRLWGKYTPRIRRGKSLAGSLAAFVFGVASALLFWGFVAPPTPARSGRGPERFAFQGTLTLPVSLRRPLDLTLEEARIGGSTALVVLSLVTGTIVSASEAFDAWGLDDNLTIPALCGLALEVFLWGFGSG